MEEINRVLMITLLPQHVADHFITHGQESEVRSDFLEFICIVVEARFNYLMYCTARVHVHSLNSHE